MQMVKWYYISNKTRQNSHTKFLEKIFNSKMNEKNKKFSSMLIIN